MPSHPDGGTLFELQNLNLQNEPFESLSRAVCHRNALISVRFLLTGSLYRLYHLSTSFLRCWRCVAGSTASTSSLQATMALDSIAMWYCNVVSTVILPFMIL